MGLATAAVIGGAGASIWGAAADRKQSKKAFEAQTSNNASNAKFLAEKVEKGGKLAETLFNASAQNRILGANRALDIFGQTMPQQISTFQQGNVGAQQQLLAGLPQVQNALLGLPVDLSGLQPTQIDVDTSFTQQQAPTFKKPSHALQAANLSGVLPNNRNVVGGGFFDLPLELGNFGSSFQPFGG